MPILQGAVSLARFRVAEAAALADDPTRSLPAAFRAGAFSPLDRDTGEEERSAGWVELEDAEATGFAPAAIFRGEDACVSWRVDQVRVPPALVKSRLAEWRAAFEGRRGRRPSKRETAAEKERVLRKLRKQAFVQTKTHDVRWRLDAGELEVWATAQKAIEEICVALEEGLGLVLRPLGPGPRWEDAGLDVDALAPTPALFGEEVVGGG
jgi:DNA recombination-dependent growth factor C